MYSVCPEYTVPGWFFGWVDKWQFFIKRNTVMYNHYCCLVPAPDMRAGQRNLLEIAVVLQTNVNMEKAH